MKRSPLPDLVERHVNGLFGHPDVPPERLAKFQQRTRDMVARARCFEQWLRAHGVEQPYYPSISRQLAGTYDALRAFQAGLPIPIPSEEPQSGEDGLPDD